MSKVLQATVFSTVAALLLLTAPTTFARGNIVTDVVSAPVVGNGIVAGEPTEFNIFLSSDEARKQLAFDAEFFGHQIPAGGRMEIELGEHFLPNPQFVGPLQANANIILTTGHPQNPIVATAGTGVQHGNWAAALNGRIITITPQGGSGANGLENARAQQIGFKVIHLRPGAPRGLTGTPFLNGAPGTVGKIKVRIYDADGNIVDQGRGNVVFRASVGRQVHVTNVGLTTPMQGSPATVSAALVESSNFQHVAPGTTLTGIAMGEAPYAPRFLLFEAVETTGDSFIPMPGIADVSCVIDAKHGTRAVLMQSGQEIGEAVLHGPSKAPAGRLLGGCQTLVPGNGNGTILTVPMQVGQHSGAYRLELELDDGGEATNVTIVE